MLWWWRKGPEWVEGLPIDDSEFWSFMNRRPDDDDDEERRRWIDEGLALWPTHPYMHLCSSILHRAEGHQKARLADLCVALALDPDDPVIYYHVAHALREMGREELVEAVLEKGWEAWERLLKLARSRPYEGQREEYFDLDRRPADPKPTPPDDQT